MRNRDMLNIRKVEHLRFQLGLRSHMYKQILAEPSSFYHARTEIVKGKERRLAVPQGPLMAALKRFNALLQGLRFPTYMMGGLKGRSSLDNARVHTGRAALLKADIRDFFPSIHADRVEGLFRGRLGCSTDVAAAIASLCTFDDELPQGAPTSTVISNLIIEHLASRLHGLALAHGAKYTQFVDDSAVSGPAYIGDLEYLVAKIINEEGFTCHPGKLCTLLAHEEQVVTGSRVNRGLDAPSKKLKTIKEEINRLRQVAQDGLTPSEQAVRSLNGKLAYIGRLNSGTGKRYRRQLVNALHTSPEAARP